VSTTTSDAVPVDKPVKVPYPDEPMDFFAERLILRNAPGSYAGAGSGQFHQYRMQRRREMARLGEMKAAASKEKELNDWESQKNKRVEDEEKKRAPKQKKREKKKRKERETRERAKSEKAAKRQKLEPNTTKDDNTKNDDKDNDEKDDDDNDDADADDDDDVDDKEDEDKHVSKDGEHKTEASLEKQADKHE